MYRDNLESMVNEISAKVSKIEDDLNVLKTKPQKLPRKPIVLSDTQKLFLLLLVSFGFNGLAFFCCYFTRFIDFGNIIGFASGISTLFLAVAFCCSFMKLDMR